MSSTSNSKKAPTFCLKNQDNQEVCLKDLLGKHRFILIYFYPKDNTPGCTIEAVSFSQYLDELESLGVKVLGISKLDVKSKKRFALKHGLKLDLLADEDLATAKAYGVLKEKNMFGRKVVGINRETFLVDGKDGAIIHHWPKVKPKTHVAEVIEHLQALN